MRRTREIQRAVAQIRRQQRRGVTVDPAEIARRFGHLMPELAGRLRVLEEIQASARQAESAAAPGAVHASDAGSAGEDLTFLGHGLPDYQLFERISDGAQGVLYKARHRPTDRLVAVKVLLDGPLASELQQRRFQREIELVARLQHPYIVRLLDRGVVRGRLFFAMEYVDGLPIDDYAYAGDLSPRQIARLFGDVAEALHYAHVSGVIHRDLKPTNVLVDRQGRPHLLDFGLAKDAGPPDGRRLSSLTLAGQVFGTLPYLSPEEVVLEAGSTVDARTDVYALGVMLFEVLAGCYPYPVTGRRELVRDNILFREPMSLRKAVSRQPAPARLGPGDFDAPLEAIVRQALRKDRDQRYASAEALAVDLRSYAAGRPVQAAAEGHLDGLRRALRRYRIQLAATMVFAALALMAAVAWRQAAQRDRQARRSAEIAYQTLYRAVDKVEEGVRPFAGSTRVREELLRSLAGDLQALQAQAPGVGLAGMVAATLREKQGDVEALCGRHAPAVEHYQACLALLPAPAGDAEWVQRARVYRKLGTASVDGRVFYEQALDLAEAQRLAEPERVDLLTETVRAHLGLGQLSYDRGAYEEALREAIAALAACPPAAGSERADRLLQRLQAQGHSLEGGCRLELGQSREALQALNLALVLRSRLSASDPTDVELRHELMLSQVRVGDALRDTADVPAAQAVYGQALEIGEFLRRVDPQIAAWTYDLYGVRDRLCRLSLERHEMQAARDHAEAARNLAQLLLDGEPHNPRRSRTLGFAFVLAGRVAGAEGRWDDARRELGQAVLLHRAVQEKVSDSTLLVDLAASLELLGRCYTELGRRDDARECLQEAHDLRLQLLAAQPGEADRVVDLVCSLNSLAAWHMGGAAPNDVQRAAELLSAASERLSLLAQGHSAGGTARQYEEWKALIARNQQRLEKRQSGGTSAAVIPAAASGP